MTAIQASSEPRGTGPIVTSRKPLLTAAILAVAHVVLATAYSSSLPILEGQDEHEHVAAIQYIGTYHALPVFGQSDSTEAYQPPLFYILGALIAGPAPAVNPPPRNPFWAYDLWRASVDNKSIYIHSRVEDFPYRDGSLTVHLLRLMSAVMGAGTVMLTFAIARRSLPGHERLQLAATALVAFLPAFLVVSATVTNDALASLAGALLIYATVLAVMHGRRWPYVVLVGTATGLVWLSKLTVSFLLPMAWYMTMVGGDGFVEWRHLKSATKRAMLLSATALAISGPWFLRNIALYGDLTGTRTAADFFGTVGFWWDGWAWYFNVFQTLHRDFWIRFGWGNVVAPQWVYIVLGGTVGLAALGLLRWFKVHPHARCNFAPGIAPVLWASVALALVGSAVLPLLHLHGGQGRYFLLPALPAFAILFCLGWRTLLPLNWPRGRLFKAYLASLAALAMYAWIGVLRPAYSPPPLLRPGDLPANLDYQQVRFGDVAELVGVVLPEQRVHPGEEIRIAVCWQALGTTDSNLTEFVHIVGADTAKIGERNTYPGLGRFPTSNWRQGDLFCDDIPVQLADDAPTPGVYSVVVGMFGNEGDSANGSITVGQVVVVPSRWPEFVDNRPVMARFGEAIELVGYEADDRVLRLYWRIDRAPGQDWVLFVHLVDSTGQAVYLSDSPPLSGRFPTSEWKAGDLIVEEREIPSLNLPNAGTTYWEIGWYHPVTGERLPAVGEGVRNNTIVLPGPVER